MYEVNTMASTQIVDTAPAAAPATNKTKNKTRTFMLHDPKTMAALGRFVSTDWRYAALKAATRSHETILLRQTGTREVREFRGTRAKIEPKEIVRGGRTITYEYRPQVTSVRSFVYSGAIDENAEVETNPVAPEKTA